MIGLARNPQCRHDRGLRRAFAQSVGERFDVVYGIINLQNHMVGLPGVAGSRMSGRQGWRRRPRMMPL